MKRALIAIDLDRTTLNDQGRVSAHTRQVLQRLQGDGHLVAIITGRSTRLALSIYQELALTSPMINFDGGLGFHPDHDWTDSYSFPLADLVVKDLLDHQASLGIEALLLENQTGTWRVNNQGAQGDFRLLEPDEPLFFPIQDDNLPSLSTLQDQTVPVVNGLVLYVAKQNQFKVAVYLRQAHPNVNVQVQAWGDNSCLMSLALTDVDKYTGLKRLQDSFGISSEAVYAFGDELNDYAMIAGAAHGVVMKNGNPRLKAIADDITTFSNEEDGLARYLERQFNLI